LRETYRKLIEAVYLKWNAEKSSDVPRLMDKYKDQEAEIYDRIVRKYVFCRPQKDWQPLIEAMYRRFNPSKLTELDSIFAKYKDSEAALYRALCDKYLPTLAPDNEPLVFEVWGPESPVEVAEASEPEVLSPGQEEDPPVRLVSPSPTKAEEEELRLPSPGEEGNLRDVRDIQDGVAEESHASVPAPQADVQKEEKKKKKKRRDGGEADSKVFPPPLPRQPDRENMAGVSDFPDVILDLAAQMPHGKESQEKIARRADSSLRPKAAPRPPHQQSEDVFTQLLQTESMRQDAKSTKRKRTKKENGVADVGLEASVPKEAKRKKRRKVVLTADAAAQQTGPGNGMLDHQDAGRGPPTVHPVASLEQRRLQLKEKLSNLKIQISSQAGPQTPPAATGPDFWGRPSLQPAVRPPSDPEMDSYSYSEEDADWQTAETERQAEHRTVVLRNKLEAQLRAKLMTSIPKVPEDD